MLELTGGRLAASGAPTRAEASFLPMSDFALFERIQTADVLRFICPGRSTLPPALQRLAAVADDLRAETLGWSVFDGEDADGFDGVITRTRRELREAGLVLRAAVTCESRAEAGAEDRAREVLTVAALPPGTAAGGRA